MFIYVIKTPHYCYVGSSLNPQRRFRQHLAYIKSGSHWLKKMVHDFKQNKLQSLYFEILEKCTEENRDQREQFWIDRFSGDSGLLNKRAAQIPNRRHRTHKGRHLSKKESARMRSFRTKDSIERLRQAGFDAAWPVLNLETGEVYPSARIASKKIGVGIGQVRAAAGGRAKSAGGFRLKFQTKSP